MRGRSALPPRYIFYPANTWHHKNHARLIEALARYRRETGETLTLVRTGVGKEGETKLGEAVERAGLRDSVRVLGFVPRADLPALYAGAACLVFASLFEGFGIPLAEAMLVGCPIAASDTNSIPEVVGDAAVLFDPRDPADIARAIAAVVRDPVAAAKLVRRGRARVERFSVSRTADLTLDLLDQVRREGTEPEVEPLALDQVAQPVRAEALAPGQRPVEAAGHQVPGPGAGPQHRTDHGPRARRHESRTPGAARPSRRAACAPRR